MGCYLLGWEHDVTPRPSHRPYRSPFRLRRELIAYAGALGGGRVDIETVGDGVLLARNAEIPVSILHSTPDGSPPEPLEYVDVVITDLAGASVASNRISGEPLDSGDIPPVVLPDLEPGRYLISLSAYRDGTLLASRERTLFVVSDPEAYVISGIAIYPPSLAPQRSGVAQASVSAPEEAPAWLRWRLEDEVVHEGYLADGADQATLQGPSSSGAYALSLDLFPHGRPPAGYVGPAPVTQQTRLFVRTAGEAANRILGPRDSYFALYHFDGSPADSGVGGEVTGGRAVAAEPIGDVKLRVSDRLFGYELNGASGFEVPGLIVPFRGDALSPFSLNFRLRADKPSDGLRVLTMEASDSGFRLIVKVDANGTPTLELGRGGATEESSAGEPLFAVGEPLDLSIAVLPGPRATRVRWYANGRYISESRLRWSFPAPEPDAEWRRRAGSTRLGGENGFVGIIDEFGVYFRDGAGEPAVYTDMYRDARRRELGSTVVYAEGFDASEPPDDTTVRGDARTEQGVLILGEGARLTLPPLSLGGDVVVGEIEAANGSADRPFTVRVASADEPLFSLDSTGVFAGRDGVSQDVSAGPPLRFRMRRAEGGLRVGIGADSLPSRCGPASLARWSCALPVPPSPVSRAWTRFSSTARPSVSPPKPTAGRAAHPSSHPSRRRGIPPVTAGKVCARLGLVAVGLFVLASCVTVPSLPPPEWSESAPPDTDSRLTFVASGDSRRAAAQEMALVVTSRLELGGEVEAMLRPSWTCEIGL